jgi:hypothetical protein
MIVECGNSTKGMAKSKTIPPPNASSKFIDQQRSHLSGSEIQGFFPTATTMPIKASEFLTLNQQAIILPESGGSVRYVSGVGLGFI